MKTSQRQTVELKHVRDLLTFTSYILQYTWAQSIQAPRI